MKGTPPPRLSGTITRVRHLGEAAAIRAVALLLWPLPHRWRLALGRLLGRLTFLVDRRHRNRAVANLTAAYPHQPRAWHRRVAKGVFAHLGRLLVELLVARRELNRLPEVVRMDGVEHLQEVIGAGKGYFLLSAHFGNWEWAALVLGMLGHPIWMVTRPLDNPYLERWFAATRGATGNRVVHKRNAIREIVKGLKERRGVAFIIDQHFPDRSAHMVSFFERPAATTPALGILAVRLGVPVLPTFAFPRPDGSYRLEFQEPLWPPGNGDPGAAALAITEAATRRIEEVVRRQPDAWFWMHRRWRTPPPDSTVNPST